jgi:hypothetical protein
MRLGRLPLRQSLLLLLLLLLLLHQRLNDRVRRLFHQQWL